LAAALTAAYLVYDGGPRPGTVLTIHNIAFQGHYSAALLAELGLPPYAMAIDGVEYFGGIGFLKAGLQLSDRITTVSPTYAREILTPQFGMALDGLLRARASVVSGIVNGIDDEVWNPATDPTIAATFSAMRLDHRDANRAALQARLGLDLDAQAPLFGVVSRFTSRKVSTCCSPYCPKSSRRAGNSRCSAPASGARGWLCSGGARVSGRVAPCSVTTRRSPISFRPASTSCSCPRASSPAG